MSDIAATPEMTTEQVSATTRQTNYGTWRVQKTWKPLHVVDAEGCWFTDGAGKRYLDFSAQLMCVNLGHKNPRVVESIAEQARELAFMGPVYATTARAKLSAKLLEVLPAGLEKFFEEAFYPVEDRSAPMPPMTGEFMARVLEAAPKCGLEFLPPASQ